MMLNAEDYRGVINQYLRTSWKNVSQEDREDIEQVALIQLHRKIESNALGHVSDMANYARRIAQNCGLDMLKKRRCRVKTCSLAAMVETGGEEPQDLDVPDMFNDIDLRIDLMDFLESLNPRQRQYCKWRAEGRSDDEIAAMTGISKTSWHRLRHRLQKRWVKSQE